MSTVDQVERSDGLRALLIQGEGKAFSAGADVKLFAGKDSAKMRPLISSFLDLGRRIEALPFPTVAAVHGTWARAIVLGGELHSAEVLAAWGVIDRVVPAPRLQGSAEAFDSSVSLFDTDDARRGIEPFVATGAAGTSYEGH